MSFGCTFAKFSAVENPQGFTPVQVALLGHRPVGSHTAKPSVSFSMVPFGFSMTAAASKSPHCSTILSASTASKLLGFCDPSFGVVCSPLRQLHRGCILNVGELECWLLTLQEYLIRRRSPHPRFHHACRSYRTIHGRLLLDWWPPHPRRMQAKLLTNLTSSPKSKLAYCAESQDCLCLLCIRILTVSKDLLIAKPAIRRRLLPMQPLHSKAEGRESNSRLVLLESKMISLGENIYRCPIAEERVPISSNLWNGSYPSLQLRSVLPINYRHLR
ncbi:hypothetical protein GGR52DRAFT_229652 [Hypoxylon sp. FL1284]|nr:hypothetical protein GGR52DRAFT_229652 [Hypoxylon sp. FL1284]